MNEFKEPGLLERTQNAIQPLVAAGDFQLETIEYGHLHGDVDVKLCSKDLDIIFHRMLRASTETHCFFKVKSAKKTFSAKYLFPALGISTRINKGKSVQNLNYRSIEGCDDKHQKIIDEFLERTGFISELNRLCIEINEILRDIRVAFSSENLDETITLYAIEVRKHEKYGRIF